jgi:predicted dehydrogenase
VQLHYENLEVVLHASSFSAAPNCRFRVEGTKGSYVKYGLDVQEEQLKNGISPNDASFGLESEDDFGCLYSESSSELIGSEQGCYEQYYMKLAEALISEGRNPVDPEEAVTVIQILELAERSSRLGETSAKLKPI